jgi:hypothetical protein
MYVYDKEKKETEQQLKLHIIGQGDIKIISTHWNRMLQYDIVLNTVITFDIYVLHTEYTYAYRVVQTMNSDYCSK